MTFVGPANDAGVTVAFPVVFLSEKLADEDENVSLEDEGRLPTIDLAIFLELNEG